MTPTHFPRTPKHTTSNERFSPQLRRLQLGAELRKLRKRQHLTADQVGKMLHHSRMKISRLENGQVRPDLSDVLELLDLLQATDPEHTHITQIARQAAARGWWDAYPGHLQNHDRWRADLESAAATISEYQPHTIPTLLHTPEYTQALTSDATADPHPPGYLPKRHAQVFHPNGPTYDVVLDEVALQRFTAPPAIMRAQLRHLIDLHHTHPNLTIHVLSLRTPPPAPRFQAIAYTFPTPDDSPAALVSTLTTTLLLTGQDAAEYLQWHEAIRKAALPEAAGLTLLSDLAERLT